MNIRCCCALLLILFSLSISAEENACSDLSRIEFMLGDWQVQSNTRRTNEVWRRVNSQYFEGEGLSFLLATPEQIQRESLRIVSMSNQVFYLAKVPSNPYPVAFKLTQCTSTRAVFVNPQHDFPNQLVYSLKDGESLFVEVTDNAGKGFSVHYLPASSQQH